MELGRWWWTQLSEKLTHHRSTDQDAMTDASLAMERQHAIFLGIGYHGDALKWRRDLAMTHTRAHSHAHRQSPPRPPAIARRVDGQRWPVAASCSSPRSWTSRSVEATLPSPSSFAGRRKNFFWFDLTLTRNSAMAPKRGSAPVDTNKVSHQTVRRKFGRGLTKRITFRRVQRKLWSIVGTRQLLETHWMTQQGR